MSVELAPGVVVAKRYQLERVLGQGGMGIVWAAVHRVTHKRVALKFLKGPFNFRPDLRRRFLREARAASAIVHPNVLEIHDVFELEDETPVMLMDFLEGETLGQRIARDGKLPLPETAELLAQVVSGVGMAHAVGVVHRDLKPDNVFLVQAGTGKPSVRVLDFGIAKLVGSEGQAVETAIVTGTGSMLGTPCYMSPEQTLGEKDIDYRTDIWSIGIMVYECLTGMRPVEGSSLGQVVKRLLSDGITPLSAVAPTLPRDVTDLVDGMLNRERERRPRDLRDVQEVLLRYTSVRPPSFEAPIAERTERTSGTSNPPQVVIDSGGADPIARTTRQMVDGAETGGPHSVSQARQTRRSGKVTRSFVGGAVALAAALIFVVARAPSAPPASNAPAQPSAPPKAATDETRSSAAAGQPETAPPSVVPALNPGEQVTAPASTQPALSKDAKSPARATAGVHGPLAAHAAPSASTSPAPSASPSAPVEKQPHGGGLAQEPPF